MFLEARSWKRSFALIEEALIEEVLKKKVEAWVPVRRRTRIEPEEELFGWQQDDFLQRRMQLGQRTEG